METMFVDEGFGSLDEETLRQAMQALSGLSEIIDLSVSYLMWLNLEVR